MNKKLQEEINKLRKQIKKAEKERDRFEESNKNLQDEVDSLWTMLDEINKTDIQNWTHILDKLKTDTAAKALMMSKDKVEA
jgi:predicted nuclease with TOPRIM domain